MCNLINTNGLKVSNSSKSPMCSMLPANLATANLEDAFLRWLLTSIEVLV